MIRYRLIVLLTSQNYTYIKIGHTTRIKLSLHKIPAELYMKIKHLQYFKNFKRCKQNVQQDVLSTSTLQEEMKDSQYKTEEVRVQVVGEAVHYE